MSAEDYETYKQIKEELSQPIDEKDLDRATLKKLYESKLVYLDYLRIKCFTAVNQQKMTPFTIDDYTYILDAIKQTKAQITKLVRSAVLSSLELPFCDTVPGIRNPSDRK
ncbi:MAG: hypothetical protein HYW48_02055 [Deltaproteobacteria bacterium]|nr:hypothetical protein [Deltaproteobacteria bacterium]